jgi:hypothetical protein
MNSVDIYINDLRLDLFDDEEISINLSVQNIQDISKVFTDFTQGFTVPATAWNNAIFSHYYRTDVDSSTITKNTLLNGNSLFLSYQFRVLKDGGRVEAGACCADALDELGGSYSSVTTATSFDGRFRQPARIEINSLPFRTGVVQIENVQLKGTEPYAYSITFYGDVVNMSDLFGEDYLYDLDFSAFDLDYTDDNIYDGLTTDTFAPLFFPLMSPVKNWIYDSGSGGGSHSENNIAYHTGGGGHGSAHGINYYELKPALKVTAVLDAIEAKYGITFTGSFLSSVPFTDLALWLHRREGYMYEGQPSATAWEIIDFDATNSPTPDWFTLDTETWSPVGLSGTGDIYDVAVTVDTAYADDYYIGVFRNGVLVGEALANGTGTTTIVDVPVTNNVESLQIAIRPSTNVAMTYEVTQMTITSSSAVTSADVYMTAATSYSLANIVVTDLMPEIKVKDFLAGILKMYNMVIVPSSPTSFLLQPLEDWYAAGTDVNYQTYFDITEYAVNRPSLYREIEFNYQDTDQILGAQYRNTNNTGFGDLRAFFNFDGEDFLVEVPFECPLFERLTDLNGGTLTNVLVYKSITNEIADDGVSFKPYLGSPVVFYGYFDDYDISGTAVSFVDSDGTTQRRVNGCWYANTSNRYQSAGASHSICFGADIDPYHLQSVSRSLYNNEWSNYITDLYNAKRRIFQLDAVLPVGKILTLDLKNAIVWNNNKYIVNSAKVNMTTGKATFELLNVV